MLNSFLAAIESPKAFSSVTIDQSSKAVALGRIGIWPAGRDPFNTGDVLMIIGANGLVGDCALHSAHAYVVSAVAATDTVVCMVPVAILQEALSREARLAAQHQALSSMRFRVMLRHVAAQGSNTSRRRVCLHLLDLVNSYGVAHESGTAISIAFTQQEMGSICGLSRVSVSHIFTWLAREGVITRAGRIVVVVDVARLALLSRT